MQSQLENFFVQVHSVRLQSSYIASIAVLFEVTLQIPPDQQAKALEAFANYFSSPFSMFAGYSVRDGNRDYFGISSAGIYSYRHQS